MFCSNCGNKLAEEDKFCMVCGTPRYIQDASEEVEDTPVQEMDFEDQSEAGIEEFETESEESESEIEDIHSEENQEVESFEADEVDLDESTDESEIVPPINSTPIEEQELQETFEEDTYEELKDAEEFEPEEIANEPDFEESVFEDDSEESEVTPFMEDSNFATPSYEDDYANLSEAEEFEPTPVDEPNAHRESEPFIAQAPEEPMRSQRTQQAPPVNPTTEEGLNRRGQPKKEGKKKEGKKKGKGLIIGLIALIVIVVAGFFGFQYITTERAYEKAMDDGISEMLVSNYEAAEGHFKSAMDLKPNEDEASNLYNQTLLYNEALALFEEADYEGALEKANEAVTFESSSNASKALLTKTNELIAEIEQIESDLAKVIEDQDAARALMEAGSLESALGIVNELRRNPLLDDPMYKEFKSSVKTLHEEITAKISEEAENERVRAEEERQRELAEALEAAAEAEAAEAEAAAGEIDISGKSLNDYKAIDIEYARIIEMIGYPGSGTVYATKEPAGTAIVSNIADSPVFPQAVTYLTGEYTADGMIVYSSHGNGYITLYPVPSHWHQDDQSEEGYRKYAQEILDSAIDVYVEVGDEAKIISRLERTTFVK